ncbi:hypothetical protein EDB89DRAFT_1917503 [Lactarius sanguifluus]|nr:hypothetical protein EDB89DRAFT_1917503 [Lactarius sanguifluus]
MGGATDYSDSTAHINAVRTRTPPATARRRTTFLRPTTTDDSSEDSDGHPRFPAFAWKHKRPVSDADPSQILVEDDKKPKGGVKTLRPSVFTAPPVQSTSAAADTLSDSDWTTYASDRSARHAKRKLAAHGLTQVPEHEYPSTPIETPQVEAPADAPAGGDTPEPRQRSPPPNNDHATQTVVSPLDLQLFRANAAGIIPSPHVAFNSDDDPAYEDTHTQGNHDYEKEDAQQKSFEDE